MKASAGSKHSSPAWLGLLAVVLVLSCGKSESPSGPNPPVDEGPNPDGVLLSGDAAGNALDAIRTLLPWSAAGTEIQDDGFVMTRLTVVIAPDATVGQVNVLLQSHDLRIICMRKDMPIVSLKTAALADTLAANDLIQVLLADPAIAFAFRYYAAQSDPVAVAPDAASATKTTPGGSANSELSPLKAMKMPAAWNVRGLVTSALKTRVMVPDSYRRLTPHPEITAQRFVTGAGHTDRLIKASPDDPGVQVGNHGFHVSGIIGADWDASGATGACPDAQQHLDLLSFPMGSLNLHDLSVSLEHEINASFPSGKFVLNTSLGYNDPAFTFVPKALRAWDMLLWRAVGVQIQDRCLHLTSAGNAGMTSGDGGLASFNSPYTAASRFDDPLEMIAGVNLTEVQRTTLTGLVNRIVAADPRLLSRLTNTLIVGSNTYFGPASPFSNRGADIRCIGEYVFGPCVEADPGFTSIPVMNCDGTDAYYNGTSQATPMVSGLAAYLWNLNPNLSLTDLREILIGADVNHTLDGYLAVQALDISVGNGGIRKALLDVATTADLEGPDGRFTEHDLALFLQQFHFYEAARVPAGSEDDQDFSRYDLNGNGLTGGRARTDGMFDLDVNNPQSLGTATQTVCDSTWSFDETRVSDYDILTYYAFSPLYTGDETQRDALLPCPTEAPQYVIRTSLPSQTPVVQTTPFRNLKVGIAAGADTTWGAYSVRVSLVGGRFRNVTGTVTQRETTVFPDGQVDLDFYLFRDVTAGQVRIEALGPNGVLHEISVDLAVDTRTRWNGTFEGAVSFSGEGLCMPLPLPLGSARLRLDCGLNGDNLWITGLVRSAEGAELSQYFVFTKPLVNTAGVTTATFDADWSLLGHNSIRYWAARGLVGTMQLTIDLQGGVMSGVLTSPACDEVHTVSMIFPQLDDLNGP